MYRERQVQFADLCWWDPERIIKTILHWEIWQHCRVFYLRLYDQGLLFVAHPRLKTRFIVSYLSVVSLIIFPTFELKGRIDYLSTLQTSLVLKLQFLLFTFSLIISYMLSALIALMIDKCQKNYPSSKTSTPSKGGFWTDFYLFFNKVECISNNTLLGPLVLLVIHANK